MLETARDDCQGAPINTLEFYIFDDVLGWFKAELLASLKVSKLPRGGPGGTHDEITSRIQQVALHGFQ